MKYLLRSLFVFVVVIEAIVLLIPGSVQAMSHSYQQGASLAQSLPMPQPGGVETMPGYAGTDLPQSHIKAHDIGSEALKAAKNNEASKLIAETIEKKEKFVIDPHTDPLIVEGNRVIADPEKTLNESIIETEVSGGGAEELKTCEEGGEEYLQKCSKRLEVILKVTPEKGYTAARYCDGRWRGAWARGDTGVPYWCRGASCPGCIGGGYVITQHKKVEVVREEWVDECAVLEALAEKGLCRYISKATSPKNETRTIDGEPVKRDHFEEYFQYACMKASSKSCVGLRERGCYQVKSVCREKVDGLCVLWEQTYRCPSSKIGGKSYRSSNKENPFCLSGDCADKSYEANKDFAEVMSHLSVLKEAGAELRSFGFIFKGQDRRCTRNCVDFRDCCGNGNGWGVSLRLASCDAGEKELAELRKKNRCVQVGTYCAEKVLGVCIRKKTTFCCYGTKLAKIVQEQGKGQLGLGFGSPEQPQCQGLTPEQLSRLDFSRINFSDMFDDIVASTKIPNREAITKGIQKSMETKASLLNIKEKRAPSVIVPKDTQLLTNEVQGRKHGKF